MSLEAEDQQGECATSITEQRVLTALARGRVTERGLLPYSSNHSFLVLVSDDDVNFAAVYKPQHGESPLWDFEWGTLCKRETAAFLISSVLGWNLVPPTVLRKATRGTGSVQFYVEHDANAHYFTVQADARFADSLRRLALFDYVANNADRKSGHCLIGLDGRLWAIDHGICFHVEYKLRTVIWEFSDEAIAPVLLDDLDELRMQLVNPKGELTRQLCSLLSEPERKALNDRVHRLLRKERYPAPPPHRRNYPWPPI
jgi:uncharacterized repeat protein (TIGR03843 family)